jgi:hypothetical protein
MTIFTLRDSDLNIQYNLFNKNKRAKHFLDTFSSKNSPFLSVQSIDQCFISFQIRETGPAWLINNRLLCKKCVCNAFEIDQPVGKSS